MAPKHPLATPSRWRRTELLAGDASSRRYSRLEDRDGHTWVLAEYPAETRRMLPRDLEVLHWMRARHLRVPDVLDHDVAGGWMLLEDLGSEDAEQALRAAPPAERPPLFAATLAPLIALSTIDPDQLPSWNPPLDRGRLRWELCGFELWFVVGRTGRAPDAQLMAWLDTLAERVAAHPRRVCHRDYHLNNLFFLEGGDVGMIDFQDVLLGPDTYDAVSLVAERAAPQLIGEAERERWIERWAERTGAAPGWRQRMAQVRTQRALKVLGTFSRLSAAGHERYRHWLEALTRELAAETERLQLHPLLTELLLD